MLFDGSAASFDNWKHVTPDDKRERDWEVKDGALLCAPGSGYIMTKEEFGDCQLHIEWAAPVPVHGIGQGRGNSGVFLMGMVEVQVLDNYQDPTYADGTVGAVYGVMPPDVNALRPPGEWQSYDIIFRRPIVRDGELLDPGSLTVLCNGVVVQNSTPLEGGGGYKARQPLNKFFPDKGSLKLQDHGNPVRYRNIWYRPLRPRPLDGGTDGRLSTQATLAKRAEIAAMIRADAVMMESMDRAFRLLESLIYEENQPAYTEVAQLVAAYVEHLKALSGQALKGEKDTALKLDNALHYLRDHKFIAADYPALSQVRAIVDKQNWRKRR